MSTFPHRVAVRLTAHDLFEVTRYCRDRKAPFRLDGRVDSNPERSRPVKLWFTEAEIARYVSERFTA